jgi:hypothetical protein
MYIFDNDLLCRSLQHAQYLMDCSGHHCSHNACPQASIAEIVNVEGENAVVGIDGDAQLRGSMATIDKQHQHQHSGTYQKQDETQQEARLHTRKVLSGQGDMKDASVLTYVSLFRGYLPKKWSEPGAFQS